MTKERKVPYSDNEVFHFEVRCSVNRTRSCPHIVESRVIKAYLQVSLIVFSMLFSSQSSFAGSAKKLPVFKYKFYAADIFPWIEGRSGSLPESKGKMAKALEKMIKNSRSQVKASIYGVKDQSWFMKAVKNVADKPSAVVDFVVDQKKGRIGDWKPKNFTYSNTAQLPALVGFDKVVPDIIPDVVENSHSIMHNKFVVVDRRKVWFGSTNISNRGIGAEYNANNALIVDSRELAAIYSAEFRQMFVEKKFSTLKNHGFTDKTISYAGGTKAHIFFSPQDDPVENAVIPFIDNTKKTLDIGMFFLTDKNVGKALKRAVARGVKVRLIYDSLAASHRYSFVKKLKKDGVDVRVENWGGRMHMKTAVSDKKHTLIGSMNWSAAGSHKNDENTVVVENHRKLASDVTKYFNKLWKTLDGINTGLVGTVIEPEGPSSINSCLDGIDNDEDGLVDSEDPNCF